MKTRLILGLLVAAAILSLGGPAGAVVQLGNLDGSVVYNQQDSPCFIGYSCGPNLGIPMTTWTGSVPSQGTEFSPVYSGTDLSNLLGLIGTTPYIAIDLNQDGRVGSPDTAYTLDYVKVYIDGNLAYLFGAPGNSPTTVPQIRTGNGDSDYVIPGLVLTPGSFTTLQFEVQWGNFAGTTGDNTDGKELFFLVNANTPQVPEPGLLLLLGAGLFGVGFIARWRMEKK